MHKQWVLLNSDHNTGYVLHPIFSLLAVYDADLAGMVSLIVLTVWMCARRVPGGPDASLGAHTCPRVCA
jgi:hypothetical protein